MVLEKDKSLILVLRIVSFGCGVGLLALGITTFITFSISGVRSFFITVYYLLFGLLVCLSEMPCDRLMSCFVFLKYFIGKSIFYLFLATITFTWDHIYYLIISIALFCASGLYFILFISCRNRENINQKDQKEPEVKGFEKRDDV